MGSSSEASRARLARRSLRMGSSSEASRARRAPTQCSAERRDRRRLARGALGEGEGEGEGQDGGGRQEAPCSQRLPNEAAP